MDGDIPGWRSPRLSMLYSALPPLGKRRPKKDWRSIPLFAHISREARDFLEGVGNVRNFDREEVLTHGDPKSKTYGQVLDRWMSTEWVKVRPLAREFGGSGVAEYAIDPCYSAKDLQWLNSRGMRPEDVMRPPRSGDWYGLRPEEILEGQRRVIVNLETLEYIDPVKFGHAPTLAGMVSVGKGCADTAPLTVVEP